MGIFHGGSRFKIHLSKINLRISTKIIEKTPALLWTNSEGNVHITQISAGRLHVRAQLAATAQGLSMQPIFQALQEYPALFL
jgi:hypothetical protein